TRTGKKSGQFWRRTGSAHESPRSDLRMASEVIAFILLSAATVAASAIIAGYMASAASETTARINEQAHRQVLMLSESLSVTSTYTCGTEFCIDVMNNSGRQIGISYAYDGGTGNSVGYRIL